MRRLLAGLGATAALLLVVMATQASAAQATVTTCTSTATKAATPARTTTIIVTCDDTIQGLEVNTNKPGLVDAGIGGTCSNAPSATTASSHYYCFGGTSKVLRTEFTTTDDPCAEPALTFDIKEPGGFGTQAATTSATLDCTPPAPPPSTPPPPVITMKVPAVGLHVAPNQTVHPLFSCSDPGGPGIASCEGRILPPKSSLDFTRYPLGLPVLGDGTDFLRVGAGSGVWRVAVTAIDADPTSPQETAYGRNYTVDQPHTGQLGKTGGKALKGVGPVDASDVGTQGGWSETIESTYPAIVAGQSTAVLDPANNVLATGSGSVIASGSGSVIAAGSGNAINAGNLISGGANNRLALAARKHRRKAVLLASGGHTFDRGGKAKLKFHLTRRGRKAVRSYARQARRLRKAHKRVPARFISITYVVAARDGNGHGQPKAVFVTRKLRLKP